jgi:futalosine hydrolase
MSISLGSPRVILVPTAVELERLRDLGAWPDGVALIALAGFGPVAAAARAATLFASLRPRRALLVGIAGSYDLARWPVGSAAEFAACAIDGIGVGETDAFRGPPQLGFPQWPGADAGAATRIDDRVALEPLDATHAAPLLLSTCAASDSAAMAARRRARFPDACAEDMEGFGVALAAALVGVPLSVVRGISNEVGDREPSRWRIPLALGAARRLTLELLERDDAARTGD